MGNQDTSTLALKRTCCKSAQTVRETKISNKSDPKCEDLVENRTIRHQNNTVFRTTIAASFPMHALNLRISFLTVATTIRDVMATLQMENTIKNSS